MSNAHELTESAVSETPETAQTEPDLSSNLSIARNAKIGMFHVGSSMADVLTSGVWNRIATVELGLAATPVALLISLKYFLSPLSVWVGQRSDVTSLAGYRRLPYIWSGRLAMMLSFFLLGVCTVALADNRDNVLAWIGMAVSFLAFSLGSAFSGTTFLSLIYDRTPKAQRTRAISVVWLFLILGFAVAGILFSRLLPQYTTDGFMTMFIVAPTIMGILWFVSLIGEERRVTRLVQAQQNAGQKTAPTRTFFQDLSTAWANRQTRIFFVFLALTTLFYYTQDVILEPFAAQVFGMPLETTNRFSAYWGSMALVGIVASLFAARRFPKHVNNTSLTRWGLVVLVLTFALFTICSLAQIRPLVTISLVTLGIGLGMWTVGTLGLMMDMTRAWGAGLYLSLWTVSETLARGAGVAVGGIMRDIVLAISQQHTIAYGSVFLFQAIGFAFTLVILRQISVVKFQVQTQTPSAEMVFSASMD
jgi:MFS transporter, BCD family, chlorophyll transporter